MTESAKPHANGPLWLGLALGLAATLCNVVIFLNPPAQDAIPWLSLALGVVALIPIALGAKNLLTRSRRVAAKIAGTFVVLFSVLCAGSAIFVFFHARAVPPSTDAPQVGQEVPDFTLPDANSQPVSLTQLFAPAPGDAAAPPHAVLLVFYRGYW